MSTEDQFIPSMPQRHPHRALLCTGVNTRHVVIDVDMKDTLAPAARCPVKSRHNDANLSGPQSHVLPSWANHRAANIWTPRVPFIHPPSGPPIKHCPAASCVHVEDMGQG